MPKDKRDGQRDARINKLMDNTMLREMKQPAINVPNNPTDAQMGDAMSQFAVNCPD